MQTIYFSSIRSRQLERLEQPRKGALIVLASPSESELGAFAERHGLDVDIVRDAVDLYEAPRIEIDNDTVYIFTRYCHPEGREVATEPLLIAITTDALLVVSRLESPIVAQLIEQSDTILTTQKTKTLMQLLRLTNVTYRTQLNKVSKQILRFRAELKKSDISNREFIRIIELEEDLNEFLTALQPQATVLGQLTNGKYLRLYEDDRDIVEDLQLDTVELIEFTKSRLGALRSIRQVHDAIATNNLNRTFKRLTSIAIFLTIPTIIGGLWGMNVRVPFADAPYAFAVVLAIAVACVTVAVAIFKRRQWL